MPFAAPTPCCKPGCMEVVQGRFCDTHRKQDYKRIDKNRKNSTQRGYGKAWRKIRLQILAHEPLCRFCKEKGKLTAANVVDHISGDTSNNNVSNLRSLCKSCHDSRTAKDQGFGRKHVT